MGRRVYRSTQSQTPSSFRKSTALDRTEADYAPLSLPRTGPPRHHGADICIGLGREVGGRSLPQCEWCREAAEEEGLVPPALVFIVFLPTAGTRFARRPAPTPQQVAAVLREARVLFSAYPHTPWLHAPGRRLAPADGRACHRRWG